ncbi:MAG: hypothetical protein AAF599_00095 [Bacteroidota bacterium]
MNKKPQKKKSGKYAVNIKAAVCAGCASCTSPYTGKKNTIKCENDKFILFRNVSNLGKLNSWLDKNYSGWKWVNVYDRKKKQYIGSYTKKTAPTGKDF